MTTVLIALTSAFNLGPEFALEQVRAGITDELRPAVGPEDITLVSQDLESDILHTDAIPMAEFEYLKSHSVFDLLEELRRRKQEAWDEPGRHRNALDGLLNEAILMISALNAVKVMGEAAESTG